MFVLVAFVAPAGAAGGKQYVWLRGFDGQGERFDLGSLRGQVVALTFTSRATRDEATEVNQDLAAHAGRGQATVVSVVDFEGIPRFGRKTARKRMVKNDQPGRLVHIADEKSQLRGPFEVDPQERVDILVIDRSGALRGRFSGGQVDQAIALMERLKGTSRAAR